MLMGLIFAGMLSAQDAVKANVQTFTKSGTLSLKDDKIIVQNEKETFYALGFEYLIGRVKDLKDGAKITLEGFWLPGQKDSELQYFVSTKLSLNGKEFPLVVPGMHREMMRNKDNHWDHQNDWRDHRDERQHERERQRDRDRDRDRNRGRQNPQENDRGRW